MLVGFNSTRGAIEEAMTRLEQEGMKVNHAHVRLIHPFPTAEIDPLVKKAKRVVVVENNATGQLANIMKMNLGNGEKISSLLKYDGNPFLPKEIYNECKRGCIKWQHLRTFVTVKPNWCPGCGDFSVQAAIQRAATNVGLNQMNLLLFLVSAVQAVFQVILIHMVCIVFMVVPFRLHKV